MKFLPALFFAIVCGMGIACAQAPSAAITPSTSVYSPSGGTITFTINLVYSGEINGMGFELVAPSDWVYGNTGGNNPPSIAPRSGDTGTLGFSYISVPPSPVGFTFTLTYPAGMTGNKTLTNIRATFRPIGGSIQNVALNNVIFTPGTTTPSAPVITTQPANFSGTVGSTVMLSVVASGTDPLSYQWRKDGTNVAGATTATLNLQGFVANSGSYTVMVSNSVGSTTSSAAVVRIADSTSSITITTQPVSRSVTPGSSVAFSVAVTGTGPFTYQWRKNGTPIAGGSLSSFTVPNVAATDAGSYDVVVFNAAGAVTSAAAQLTVAPVSSAPVISEQPGPKTVSMGAGVSLSVVASGNPAPTYQWRKDGTVLSGATSATLAFASVKETDAGDYSVVVSNSVGSVTSAAVTLTVVRSSYAGTYFGTFGSGRPCALYVDSDNSGAFLSFEATSQIGYVARSLTVDANGRLRLTVTVLGSAVTESGAAANLVVEGTISSDGTVAADALSTSAFRLTATRAETSGTLSATAGFYQAGAAGSSAQLFTIVSNGGRAFALVNAGGGYDAGLGTLVAITTSGGRIIVQQIVNDTAALTATVTEANNRTSTYAGFAAGAAALAGQRIVNISTRTTAGTGEQVAIVGFVIEGTVSKPVLIRAVGPTLRNFGVATALTAPALEVRRDGALVASNTDWRTLQDGGALAAAAKGAGAFALGPTSADSALLVTLEPGHYTATVSAADGRPGAGLIEVYDLSAASGAQKLVNLSTRAVAGAGDSTLIAGVVVSGTAPKRVLIRGAGPALAQFGLGNVLSRPQLTLFAGESMVAQNAGWSTSTDAAAIAQTGVQIGAFAFPAGSADAALLLNLAPGAYTAQLTGLSGTTGVALVEIYEVP